MRRIEGCSQGVLDHRLVVFLILSPIEHYERHNLVGRFNGLF